MNSNSSEEDFFEIEKKYKRIYYYKDLCNLNIEYFRKYSTYHYENNESILLKYISLNKLGFYTIEGQEGKLNKNYKQREFMIGFFNKNHFSYFKEYLSNRGDIFFDFKSYNNNPIYNFTNMIIDDTDLILKNKGINDFTKVWKIEKEFEFEKQTNKIYEEYKEFCNELFFENLCNNYLILFISDKNYKSNVCILKILLFLIEYSTYKIKEEREKLNLK
jgi:hypothetical protein